jgi:hypothetical protein
MWHAYDKNEAFIGEGYAILGNSFDPSKLSSSCAERYKEQQNLDNYGSSVPSRRAHYLSDKNTTSDFGNGFENLDKD